MNFLFVYGSLKRGKSNHRILSECKFIREEDVVGRIYSLGAFPGFKSGGNGLVKGEIYEVDDEKLKRLDRFEGHPHFYERKKLESLKGEYGDIFIYEYKGDVREEDFIKSGVW